MSPINPLRDKEQMYAYLLGQLPAAQVEQLEEAYFGDDATFALLEEARFELLDDYARGKLAPERAVLVEELLARSPDPASLAVARGLVSTPPRRLRVRWAGWGIAASLAIVGIGAAGWMARDNARLRSQLSSMAMQPVMARLSLTQTTARSASAPPETEIPNAATVILVELALGEPDPVVDVVIEGAGIQPIRMEGLHRDPSQPLSFYLASELLPPGDYEFLISKSRPSTVLLATFPCRISRR